MSENEAARASGRLAYSVAEVAAKTGLGQSTVRRLTASGQIPSAKLGGRRVVPVHVLDELLHPGREPFARPPHPVPVDGVEIR